MPSRPRRSETEQQRLSGWNSWYWRQVLPRQDDSKPTSAASRRPSNAARARRAVAADGRLGNCVPIRILGVAIGPRARRRMNSELRAANRVRDDRRIGEMQGDTVTTRPAGPAPLRARRSGGAPPATHLFPAATPLGARLRRAASTWRPSASKNRQRAGGCPEATRAPVSQSAPRRTRRRGRVWASSADAARLARIAAPAGTGRRASGRRRRCQRRYQVSPSVPEVPRQPLVLAPTASAPP